MSKPKITVTISGPTGSGKSTLARYLAADLKIRHGVDVKLIDDHHEQPLSTSTHHLPYTFGAEVTIDVEQK
jgi:adenylate kinase family enzyme